MKIQKLDHSQIDECSLLFMDVFSREPWNEQYKSEEEVRNYFLNFLFIIFPEHINHLFP